MKEDNISQLGDYDAHSVYNNTRMGLVISLSSNLNHLISLIPQTESNFRYLLSCGTIGFSKMSLTVSATRVRKFIYIGEGGGANLFYFFYYDHQRTCKANPEGENSSFT